MPFVLILAAALPTTAQNPVSSPAPWRNLPLAEPEGIRAHTGSFIVKDPRQTAWKRPDLPFRAEPSTGRKSAKVVVLVFDPTLKSQNNTRLFTHLKGTDPAAASRILADVVRQASWGYINYDIIDVIRLDAFPRKVDGFRYTETSYLDARRTQKWQPAHISYAAALEDAGLLPRLESEAITEVWLWGADGFHFDEFAGFIPNRYARFAPTDNPWFYRPYDIPTHLSRTTWVMGFNTEVGPDNMIHSYLHRAESMLSLAIASGLWDAKTQRDPWNLFSRPHKDLPAQPAHIGNCHVPPNGLSDYDYNRLDPVPSLFEAWNSYPDLAQAKPFPINSAAWGQNQFGYLKWWLERLPKFPGHTTYGYNNWWLYIANPDEELASIQPIQAETFIPPADAPSPPGSLGRSPQTP
jgi:hypothetical protein